MPTLNIFTRDNPGFAQLLAQHKMTFEHLCIALDRYAEHEGLNLHTVVGLAVQGCVGNTDPNWDPYNPAIEGTYLIPWLQLYELLEWVPPGTTGDWLRASQTVH